MKSLILALPAIVVGSTVGTPAIDVIVVGAGQAGIAAAHRLAGLGYSVQILEANNHPGGRTRNFDLATSQFDSGTDDIFEAGGTWLSPDHTAALSQCEAFGIEVFNASFVDPSSPAHPDDGKEFPWWFWGTDYPTDQALRVGSTVFHGESGKFLFRSPSELERGIDPAVWSELEAAGGIIDRASASLDDRCWNVTTVGSSWAQLDEDTTGGTLAGTLRSAEAKQILRNTIHDHNAQEPEEVSFLYNLMSWKGCNSDGPDTAFRVRGGMQAVALAAAEFFGERLKLGSVVAEIHSEDSGVSVHTRSGEKHVAKAVVVTGPPPAILGIEFVPPLQGPEAQLLQRFPMGVSMKFAAVYTGGAWWRDLGLQGDILATRLPEELSVPGLDLPVFEQCMDHSPFSQNYGVIACFVEGRQNLYFSSLPQEQQQEMMLSFLELSFNDTRVRTLEPTFVAHNWIDEPFARGAYTGFFSPGVQSIPEYWAAYREMEKAPNVFLAGADYHAGFGNGYIEGAIRSGHMAAKQIHTRLQKPSTIAVYM